MTLLYFSPVPWESYLQRPHYMARYFLAHTGRRVVWIDPYATRMPRLADIRSVWQRSRVRPPVPDGLTVVRPAGLPIEPLSTGRWLNRTVLWHRLHGRLPRFAGGQRLIVGIGRPHSLALSALERLDPAWSFYDAMDDFPEFYDGRSQRAARETEHTITTHVSTILTASSALWDKFSGHGDKRRMVRNGFDMTGLPPLAPRPAGPPVFGYVGCVGSWFDWPLVVRLARSLRNALIHIIGPRYVAPPTRLPSNVKLFPACDHAHVIAHLQQCSAGLIPFKRTRLTQGVDPIKYYAYRAMGLPVLSTAFGDMAARHAAEGVFHIGDDGSLESTAYAALGARADLSDVQRFRDAHSWERRFSEARLFTGEGRKASPRLEPATAGSRAPSR